MAAVIALRARLRRSVATSSLCTLCWGGSPGNFGRVPAASTSSTMLAKGVPSITCNQFCLPNTTFMSLTARTLRCTTCANRRKSAPVRPCDRVAAIIAPAEVPAMTRGV